MAPAYQYKSRCGASLGDSQSNTSKMYVRGFRLTSHESETTQKAQMTSQHHHHGDGAALPSGGMDLMMPGLWKGMCGLVHVFFFETAVEQI